MTSWIDKLMVLQRTYGRPFSNQIRKPFAVVGTTFFLSGINVAHAQAQGMMVRISGIEVDAKYLARCKAILKGEARLQQA